MALLGDLQRMREVIGLGAAQQLDDPERPPGQRYTWTARSAARRPAAYPQTLDRNQTRPVSVSLGRRRILNLLAGFLIHISDRGSERCSPRCAAQSTTTHFGANELVTTLFRYPHEVVLDFVRAWERSTRGVAVPTEGMLRNLLETLYHASLATDEGRPVRLAVCFSRPQLRPTELSFVRRRQFDVAELARLAPILHERDVAVGIAQYAGQWEIWGIDFAACFGPVFRSSEPGSIAFYSDGKPVLQFVRGQFLEAAVNIESIGQMFESAVENLIGDVDLGKYHGVIDPKFYYAEPMYDLLTRLAAGGHGAALIVVPGPTDASEHAPWCDLVNIKYPLVHHSLWPWLRMSTRELTVLSPSIEVADARRVVKAWPAHVSSLAEVDGALLMDDHYGLIGFGVEIVARSEVTQVRLADGRKAQIDGYGTRHRSAIRLCDAYPGAVSFVCSQDGGVKAIRRVGRDVELTV
ncbi:putative sensor domain DACNV-containing protein [Sorangium sp. So ce406]|uniref:putative sensor domain DACNV-containing protein n=1 Tax=Sorangium sp. So ce406 TaxID=3133311 RepID=UPI003F5B6A75